MQRLSGRRGIALFISLVTVVILAIFMGAFFTAYRSHFSLTRSSNASQAASEACDSVFQYIVYRAEHDRGWGSDVFTSTGEGDPRGALMDFAEQPGTHTFVGQVYSLDARFEGTVYNNLTGAASSDVAAQAKPGTLLCNVSCKVGQSTRNARFLVRKAPLFDSSVLTRANLNVNAQRLEMRSKDENRNLLRAEGDIYVPDILDSKASEFLAADSNSPDSKGMLWAKGNIYSYGNAGPEQVDTAQELGDAARNTNGKVVPNAESHFPIFDMTQENLQLPENQVEVTVPAGRWNFVRKRAAVNYSATYADRWSAENQTGNAYAWVDVLEYYADPNDTTPSEVYRSAHRTEDLASQVPADSGGWFPKPLDQNSITTNDLTVLDYQNIDVKVVGGEGKLSFPPTGGVEKATFDLTNQSFSVHHNTRVNVEGPLHITSAAEPDADGFDSAPDWVKDTPPPTLDLGYQADPAAPGGVAKATLYTRDTLNIENGITKGLGSIISRTGDVRIQPNNTSSVNVNTDQDGSGLLVFAGGDVVLQNPDSTSDWNFKGLVYARNSVRMVGSDAEDVTFEGSVVALNGIEFQECEKIEFIYNGDLLDSYVDSIPGQRIQVETVYYKK